MKNSTAAVLLACALACAPAFAQQSGGAVKGDAERAQSKISMCVGCHGIPEYRTAYPRVYRVPLIAGQAPEYIAIALRAYKSGDRNHPSMVGIAKTLSDQDIADLAAFYGRKSGE
ncbi:MAG TPA: cytochrome c [Burkholderiales bacterium]|nr:cytochrome c [Burkholderiales bacterium]